VNDLNENIIKSLGIESLPDEQKARILEQSVQLVQQRLLLRLTNSLPDAKRDRLIELISSGNNQELDAFMAQEAPDIGTWILEETNKLKAQLTDLGEIDD
jgi:hypothetical protein